MALVVFFLVVSENDREKLPAFIELPTAPQQPIRNGPASEIAVSHGTDGEQRMGGGDPVSRPLMSPPFILGRSSPCLHWALRNSVACSRRLLDITTWTFPHGMRTNSHDANHPTAAHPSTEHHAVRVSCKDRNRLVRVQRHNHPVELAPSPRGPTANTCEGSVTWLHVGDTISVAEKVTLRLGALKLIVAPPDASTTVCGEGMPSASGPLCWFAGSDVGSSTGSSGTVSNGPGGCGRDEPLALPQVGIRSTVSWRQLPRHCREEMMLTCWTRWAGTRPSSTTLSVSRAPSAVAVSTTLGKGERADATNPAVSLRSPGVRDDLESVNAKPETAAPPSDSSRSSAVASDVNYGAGAPAPDADEAATPSHSQTRAVVLSLPSHSPMNQCDHGADSRLHSARTPAMGPSSRSQPASQRRDLSQVSSSSPPPLSALVATAASRQPQSGVLVRPYSTAGGSTDSSIPQEQERRHLPRRAEVTHPNGGEDDKDVHDSDSYYTAGETYDANLDDALELLEQRAVHVEPFTPRQTAVLGEVDDEGRESADTSDVRSLCTPSLPSKRPSARSRSGSSSGRRRNGVKQQRRSEDMRSGSVTPRHAKKRRQQRQHEEEEKALDNARCLQRVSLSTSASTRTNSTHVHRRSLADLDSLRGSSRVRRSMSGLTMSGLPARLSSTVKDSADGGGGKASTNLAGRSNANASDESQEVFFQH